METITTLVWCDLCLKVRRNVPAEPAAVRIGETTLLELDLCEKHRRTLIRSVKKALPKLRDTRGRDRHRNDRSQGPFRCQVRGCEAAPLKHRGTLHQHLKGLHQLTLTEYVEEYGEPVPLTPAEQKEVAVEARCTEDGCDQVYSTATGTRWPYQALVSHMRGRHALKLYADGRKEPIA